VRYECHTRNEKGEVGYLHVEVLFDKQDYDKSMAIFDSFREDIENAEKFSLN
jgi:hypothetical protein